MTKTLKMPDDGFRPLSKKERASLREEELLDAHAAAEEKRLSAESFGFRDAVYEQVEDDDGRELTELIHE